MINVDIIEEKVKGRLIPLSLFLWLGFLLLDAWIESFFFGEGVFLQRLFRPDPQEVWMRVVVLALLLSFSFFTQRLVHRFDAAKDALWLTQMSVEDSTVMTFWMDQEGQLLYANTLFLKMLRKTKSSLEGLGLADLAPELTEDERLKLCCEEEPLERKGIQTVLRSETGGRIPVEMMAHRLSDKQRKIWEVSAVDITAHLKVEARYKRLVKEKDILLQEVHHRVKNNLQVIASMLRLQERSVCDEEMLLVLRESRNRVRAMAIIHEKLQGSDAAQVLFSNYIVPLIRNLYTSYGVDVRRVRLKVEAEDRFVDISKAIPCALIINELVSNALKYAFPGDRKGEVRVQFFLDEDDLFVLRVSDDGQGFPEGLDFKRMDSLGLQLVTTLSDQISGELSLDKSRGSAFCVSFPARGKRPSDSALAEALPVHGQAVTLEV